MSDAAAPRWTPEQEDAITATGCNVLVAAAAGSGKTATLVERIIRRLTDPVSPIDVDQLLVVTFTEAAAAEMRDRVSLALQSALAANPGDARLQRQVMLLGRASISTLHSFCLGLLRQYFYRLGLDPAVSVMNEHEALLLRREVLDELFGRRFEEDSDGPFYALVDRYRGGRDDEGLRQLVLEVYDFAQSLPWPDQWLVQSADRFAVPAGTPIEELSWWQPIQRRVRLDLAQSAFALAEAARLARLPAGPTVYLDLLEHEFGLVNTCLGAMRSWEELAAGVNAIQFGKLPPAKRGTADELVLEQVKRLRDQAKKLVKTLQETYFARPAAEWLADLQWVGPHLHTLVEVVQEFGEAFRTAKGQQGSVDFNDLERFCLQLLLDSSVDPGELAPSEVARELRQRYAEILVDEYQDINGVQDAILTLVARDGADGAANRFMVGDVKQSIYRFRHADPSLFLAKYGSYEAASDRPHDRPGRRIVLGANFRSRAGVVDAVNFVFRQILTASVGELDYDRDAELVYHAGFPALPGELDVGPQAGPPVEVHLLDRNLDGPIVDPMGETESDVDAAQGGDGPSQGPEAVELAELSALEREARLVARRIRSIMDGDKEQPPLLVWDKHQGEYRMVRYRDIVILLRATTGRANVFMEALKQADVPAHAQLATGYFAATEIAVVLSLLRVLDNPRQDIPLAAVLHSPIVGLSGADLARVRLASPGGNFYDAVVAASRAADASGLAGVLIRFLDSLQRWRTAARRRPLSEVLWQIYQETGYLAFAGAMPGGTQRHANLLALYDRARQFDQFTRQGLFRFLRFIERLQREDADLGSAPAIGEGEDVVRIMSIHKSKGLEFPVVFVADMGKSLNRMDQQGDVLLDPSMGFGPLVVDPDLRIKYPTLAHHAVRESIRLQALAEEMRTLYVALTRARERLILVGSCRNLVERCQRWGMVYTHQGWALPAATLAGAESYLDWVGPAVLRHRDGGPLRAAAGIESPLGAGHVAQPFPSVEDREVAATSETASEIPTHASEWTVQLWDTTALQSQLHVQADAEAIEPLNWERVGAAEPLERAIESDVPASLRERFQWQYPYGPAVARFAKLSVTELKGHFRPDEAGGEPESTLPTEDARPRSSGRLERRPRFLQTTRRALTPTEFGTLMHLVLQHLDLTQPLDTANIQSQVAGLANRDLIAPTLVDAIDADAIATFFASPLGERIRQNHSHVRREVSFTLGLPAAEVYRDIDPSVVDGEIVVVQGMIDLLLETPEGFLLVDYKSDRRAPEDAVQQYRGQVAIYRRAVQDILGKPVTEVYLHFLAANQSVRVES